MNRYRDARPALFTDIDLAEDHLRHITQYLENPTPGGKLPAAMAKIKRAKLALVRARQASESDEGQGVRLTLQRQPTRPVALGAARQRSRVLPGSSSSRSAEASWSHKSASTSLGQPARNSTTGTSRL